MSRAFTASTVTDITPPSSAELNEGLQQRLAAARACPDLAHRRELLGEALRLAFAAEARKRLPDQVPAASETDP